MEDSGQADLAVADLAVADSVEAVAALAAAVPPGGGSYGHQAHHKAPHGHPLAG